jgi:hypothetical protein
MAATQTTRIGENVKRKIAALATVLTLAGSSVAYAVPDFGPGNSVKGPNDGGSKCHAPGHGTGPGANDAVPGCKG